MKKEGEKLRFWRIALGMAGLVIVVVSGISLAAFMGQKRVPAQPQEEKAVNEPVKFQDEQAVNEPTQPQEKQEVVLWVMGDFPLLKECVRNFNEGDHGYQVMIHNCYSEEQNVSWESALLRMQMALSGRSKELLAWLGDTLLRMQMALSGSTGPDIMLVESLDVDALAEQGMLEDLTPYFAQSVCLHQDDFLESVTASYTYDGKWIALPRWITIQTLWGKSGIVGDTPGWTVQEMLALAERYPDFPVIGQFARWEFLNYCVTFVPETFWLEPNGEAKDELKEMLKQAAYYPEQVDYSRWDEQCWQVCQGEALLTEQFVSKLETLVYLQEFAGEDGLIPIGYPTLDKTPKALLSPVNGLYAIPANAPNKEGAWAFLNLFFAGELDPPAREGLFYQASGIPVRKRELADELQRELQRKEDMDGEQRTIIEEWLDELIAMAGVYPSSSKPFQDIIGEEGTLYFEGVKTLEETLRVIENRGRLYFQENTDGSHGQ